MLETPAGIGVIGVIVSPWLAGLGTITVIATRLKIIVEKKQVQRT